jgi:hypothetical protein
LMERNVPSGGFDPTLCSQSHKNTPGDAFL